MEIKSQTILKLSFSVFFFKSSQNKQNSQSNEQFKTVLKKEEELIITYDS